ncbi:MAG: GHKL domain-containing protein [Bacteroides sp.]|nr:GHKL domain-containing protein [Eubacterium sp.]MCM1419027.1 GHKL domain-containing protein [Roseburia sp.]MCM1462851.1 GHKL domain-containing protein [Bacteroides sp.]
MTDLSDLAMMIVIYLAEGLGASVLFGALAVPRSRFFRLRPRAAAVFWAVFWTASNLALYLIFDATDGTILLLKFALLSVAILAAALLFFEGSFLQRIFPAVLLLAVRELALQATNCLTFVSTLTVEWISAPALDGRIALDNFLFWCKAISFLDNLLIGAVRAFLVYRVGKTLAKSYRHKLQYEKEALIYLLPALVGIMVSILLRILMLMIEDGIPVLLYVRYPALYAVVPIISLALLASIVYGFRFYQSMVEQRREAAERQLLGTQIARLRESIDETERRSEGDRAFRHDLRNHLSVLSELIRRKCPDDEEILRYFEGLRLSAERAERRIRTGNAVSDAVVSAKFARAERELPGVALDADGFLLNETEGIEPYDVGIILNNALDNAIEASRRVREAEPTKPLAIAVRSLRRRNMLLIEVENDFSGALRLGVDGLPLTSKENEALHGIGLRSIKSCAEKYAGGIDFTAEDGKFILTVLLKITQRKE